MPTAVENDLAMVFEALGKLCQAVEMLGSAQLKGDLATNLPRIRVLTNDVRTSLRRAGYNLPQGM